MGAPRLRTPKLPLDMGAPRLRTPKPPRAGQEDPVEPTIGNGAAVDDRDVTRARAGAERVGDAVPRHARLQLRELVRRIAARQHVEHAVVDRPAQRGERRGALQRRVERVDVPWRHRDHRDDLLREDVERITGIAARLHASGLHLLDHGGACHEIAAKLREDDALAHGAHLMAGASDALHAAGDGRRRLDLDHEVDGAHVDAELERRGGDECLDRPRLEPLFDLEALRSRDRAVVRERDRLLRQLVQRRRHPLREPPVVDEHERRAMRAHELEHPGMDRGPDGGALCIAP